MSSLLLHVYYLQKWFLYINMYFFFLQQHRSALIEVVVLLSNPPLQSWCLRRSYCLSIFFSCIQNTRENYKDSCLLSWAWPCETVHICRDISSECRYIGLKLFWKTCYVTLSYEGHYILERLKQWAVSYMECIAFICFIWNSYPQTLTLIFTIN